MILILRISFNVNVFFHLSDYQGAQVSLDTTHALLQTEVAKEEEESEVRILSTSHVLIIYCQLTTVFLLSF